VARKKGVEHKKSNAKGGIHGDLRFRSQNDRLVSQSEFVGQGEKGGFTRRRKWGRPEKQIFRSRGGTGLGDDLR